MKNLFKKLGILKLIPVVVIERVEDTDPICDALHSGGLPCIEVTFRTEAATGAIKKAASHGDMLVGAGTVLSIDQVKIAVDAGATFMVSPGFNPKVVSYCLEQDIHIIPGVSTPTDIEMALDLGLSVVKFFPAEAFGGVNTLKAISGPYKDIKFIPTGGISLDNLAGYLSFPKVIACGGSWLVKTEMVKKGAFDKIKALTQEAVSLIESIKENHGTS